MLRSRNFGKAHNLLLPLHGQHTKLRPFFHCRRSTLHPFVTRTQVCQAASPLNAPVLRPHTTPSSTSCSANSAPTWRRIFKPIRINMILRCKAFLYFFTNFSQGRILEIILIATCPIQDRHFSRSMPKIHGIHSLGQR
jgi:hypothetical protein